MIFDWLWKRPKAEKARAEAERAGPTGDELQAQQKLESAERVLPHLDAMVARRVDAASAINREATEAVERLERKTENVLTTARAALNLLKARRHEAHHP